MTILYFDGYCNLCNHVVDFLIRRDRLRKLKFTSLQGQTAKARLPQDLRDGLASVVLENDGQFLTESTAALTALKLLGGSWAWAGVALWIPPFIRNFLYRLVATNRYRLFGRRETCRLPSPEERAQFLD